MSLINQTKPILQKTILQLVGEKTVLEEKVEANNELNKDLRTRLKSKALDLSASVKIVAAVEAALSARLATIRLVPAPHYPNECCMATNEQERPSEEQKLLEHVLYLLSAKDRASNNMLGFR